MRGHWGRGGGVAHREPLTSALRSGLPKAEIVDTACHNGPESRSIVVGLHDTSFGVAVFFF